MDTYLDFTTAPTAKKGTLTMKQEQIIDFVYEGLNLKILE